MLIEFYSLSLCDVFFYSIIILLENIIKIKKILVNRTNIVEDIKYSIQKKQIFNIDITTPI